MKRINNNLLPMSDQNHDSIITNKTSQFLVPHLLGNPVDAADSFVHLALSQLQTGNILGANHILNQAQLPLEEAKQVIHDFRIGKYSSSDAKEMWRFAGSDVPEERIVVKTSGEDHYVMITVTATEGYSQEITDAGSKEYLQSKHNIDIKE